MDKRKIIDKANRLMPAGGFGNFDPGIIVRKAKGSRVWDVEGNEYVDLLIGSGPMIIGHAHPEVLEVVSEQLGKGMTYFANNEIAIELAEEICNAVSCAEQVRFVSTGGEADMYAMRLARAFTGREKIIKFEGGYHGMSAEAQMSLAPKRLASFPTAVPDSAGIPKSLRQEVLIAPFNDKAYFSELIHEYGSEVAAVIVEPLQRSIPPLPGYLQLLRDECTKNDIVLIFDEVVTGFRVAYGGAQELYGVTPDVCTLGKIVGGGFPLAVIAGKAEIMAHFDIKKVGQKNYLMQVGTLSGNPVAAAAGLKTLEIMRRPGQYEKLYSSGNSVVSSIQENYAAAGIAHEIVGVAPFFHVIFSKDTVRNYRDTFASDQEKTQKFDQLMRERFVLQSPAKFYISLALSDSDINQITDAISHSTDELSEL